MDIEFGIGAQIAESKARRIVTDLITPSIGFISQEVNAFKSGLRRPLGEKDVR